MRAVVVTGAGDKAFCTGIDRTEVPSEGGLEFTFDPFTYEDPGKQLGPRSNECWKPVVAAVNGMACGGAFYLLGEADILDRRRARHVLRPPRHLRDAGRVRAGADAASGMPFGEVLRMTLLGNHERISAARALEIGLVTEVVPAARPAGRRPAGSAAAIASAAAGRGAGQPALAVGGPRADPRADARRRQHLPQPRHERGGPRRGPAGVLERSAHRAPRPVTLAATVRRGRRARSGRGPRSSIPTAAALSYAELDQRSDEVAAGLRAEGIGPGDVVLLRLPSDSAYVVAYAAAAKVGAITAGVNPRLAPPEQAAVAAAAGGALDARHRRPGRGAAAARRRSPPLDDDPERPVALVFTSGTTGEPKGALFRNRQLAAVTRIDVADAWGDPAAEPTPMLAGTQFAHIGFMTKLPWYLRLGTTTHILGRWRAADALALHRRAPHPVARRRGAADGAAAARGPRGLRPQLRARRS